MKADGISIASTVRPASPQKGEAMARQGMISGAWPRVETKGTVARDKETKTGSK